MTESSANPFFMDWKRDRQEIRVDDAVFVHDGPTNTYPSHDLAHLLVGATTNLEWNPLGTRRHTRLAEYNAVLLDTIFSKVGYAVRNDYAYQPSILGACLKRMRWFVYKHYHPFPIEAEEAYCRFCTAMSAERLIRLSPHYFGIWLDEVSGIIPPERDCRLGFHPDDAPPALGMIARCQSVFAEQIYRMKAAASR